VDGIDVHGVFHRGEDAQDHGQKRLRPRWEGFESRGQEL
jgi:hypothetical protein